MNFITRPHFEDRQMVQYGDESIKLSGITSIASTVLDFTGTTTANTTVTISTVTGYLNGNRLSGFVVEPPTLLQVGTSATTTVDVTNWVLTSYDSGGTVTWSPSIAGMFTGNTSASCITDLYVTNVHGCSVITIWDSVQTLGSLATGTTSFALGIGNSAFGTASFAEGGGTTANGPASHAEGSNTISNGDASHAEGGNTIADGDYSHAEGRYTTASGDSSHAEGFQTIATGLYSHVEGYLTTASSITSHAEGSITTASGDASHAEGGNTIASGPYSHAEGGYTIASGDNSHAEGYNTIASGFYTHAEGYQTSATTSYSHSEGYQTIASGDTSHAEGYQTTAGGNYSHAEGNQTTASGGQSHAEGGSTIASGIVSHAEGFGTTASGDYSHAEGYQTIASGTYSHAGGQLSVASGSTSFVHSTNSLVIGNRSVILGGQNITGTTDDTVYVPYLNISNLGVGVSINNLGIDSNGNVVVGTSGGGGVSIDPYEFYVTGPSITLNISGKSTNYDITITANTTLDLINVRDGEYGTVIVNQDIVGSRTATFGTVNGSATTHLVVNGGGGSPTLTATPLAVDILSFTYNGSKMFWTVGNDYT